MRIVRPISAHDIDLLEHSLALLRHFGRLENHSITFAPAQSVLHLAEEAAASIGDLTSDVTVLPLQFEGEGAWPQSPNLHWTMTMEALRLTGNKDPIFWMELDCDPIQQNWADLLETDWRKGRQPFCGKIVPKPSRNAAGGIVYEPDDLMMMGCGIYPQDITSIKNWNTMVKGFFTGTNTEPFDVFMRGWMRQAGWSDTELIGDRWNTRNYRDGLICEPGPTEFKSRDHSRTDISKACVVHGCKDGSLARLILEQGTVNIVSPATLPQAAPAAGGGLRNFSTLSRDIALSQTLTPPTPKPSAPTPTASMQAQQPATAPIGNPEFEKQVTDTLTSISTSLRLFGQGLATLTAAVKESIQPAKVPTPPLAQEPSALKIVEAPQADSKPQPKADIETIRGMVNGSAVAQRVGRLAKELKMNEDRLRRMILKPDSGLIIRKGYVRLAVAAA